MIHMIHYSCISGERRDVLSTLTNKVRVGKSQRCLVVIDSIDEANIDYTEAWPPSSPVYIPCRSGKSNPQAKPLSAFDP